MKFWSNTALAAVGMNELYRQLMRAIPHRTSPDESVAGADLRSLRQWIDALPLANFNATSRQLLDKLRWLNKVRMEPLQRLETLEVLRTPIGQCVASADAQILGSSFPLTAQKAELGTLTEQFELELMLGYIQVLYDLCAPKESVPMFRANQSALAGVRALEHGGRCLQRSYQCYHAPLAGVWQSLHDVYRVVVDLKLQNRPADGSRFGGGTKPRNVYAHALLLSLINPYSYTFRELPEINAITRLLAPFCELRHMASDVEQDGTLRLADTSSDLGPGFVIEDAALDRRNLLGVDTSKVRSEVKTRINAASDDANSVELRGRDGEPVRAEIRLLRQIVGSLTADYSRDFDRLDSDQEMETVIGLHDLHNVIAGNEDFASFAQRVFGSNDDQHEVMASWVHTSSEQTRVCQRTANVLDQSLRGYRLRWHNGSRGENVRAKVGEVIGLRSERDSASNWIVGSIRWLRIDEAGDVEAGVEVLARRALPVAVRLAESQGPSRAPIRGLLMAPLRSGDAGIYSTLLVPSVLMPNLVDRSLTALRMASPNDPNRWWVDQGVRRIGATGLLDRSGTYIHFRLPSMQRVTSARNIPTGEPALSTPTGTG